MKSLINNPQDPWDWYSKIHLAKNKSTIQFGKLPGDSLWPLDHALGLLAGKASRTLQLSSSPLEHIISWQFFVTFFGMAWLSDPFKG